ncbi:hypothetical protein NMK71_07940 [Weeksellaceae bacterium KMM 9713]|uniref:Uncharacterized protein n=1 Tax=Profundicola chukchiensis TaxID=2961959 RepID=A0A9X4MWT6_9FLAO|nr:hypothetical protein [Profundicola chukchiensis]MDG4946341.1 hypothetical protein [Profundicola chukchiensis]
MDRLKDFLRINKYSYLELNDYTLEVKLNHQLYIYLEKDLESGQYKITNRLKNWNWLTGAFETSLEKSFIHSFLLILAFIVFRMLLVYAEIKPFMPDVVFVCVLAMYIVMTILYVFEYLKFIIHFHGINKS